MKRKTILIPIIILLLLGTATIVASAQQASENVSSNKTQVRVDIGTYPINKPVMVDGVIYTPLPGEQRVVFYWDKGSVHNISLIENTYYTEPGARLVFSGWSIGENSTSIMVRVNNNISIVALFKKQYYVEVSSPYGITKGSGWYDEGSRANLSVEQIVNLSPGVRAVFDEWSKGQLVGSPENYIYVFKPQTVRANWHIEYFLNLTASNTSAQVNGGGWYKEGSTVRIEAQEIVNPGNPVEERFSYWKTLKGDIVLSDPSSSTQLIVMEGPTSLQATYSKYYLVSVASAFGNPPPPTYYKEGDVVQLALQSPHEVSSGIRYVLVSWSNGVKTPIVTVVVDKPLTLIADWKKQYKLTIESTVPAVSGAGWYDEGSTATLTAEKIVNARIGVKYVFEKWTGDVESANRNIDLVMDSPKSVKAEWTKSYMSLYIDSAIILAILVGGMIIYYKVLPAKLAYHSS